MKLPETYQEFLKYLESIKIDIEPYYPFSRIDSLYDYPVSSYERMRGKVSKLKHNYIINFWETGGISGGSCWDSSNPRPYTVSNRKESFKTF